MSYTQSASLILRPRDLGIVRGIKMKANEISLKKSYNPKPNSTDEQGHQSCAKLFLWGCLYCRKSTCNDFLLFECV